MIETISRKKKLINDIIIYGLGLGSVKIFSFLFIPFITKYINPAEFAEFDLINNTITLIIPLATFQISEGVYRFLLEEKEFEMNKKYISNALNILLKNSLAITVISFSLYFLIPLKNIPYYIYIYIWLILAMLNGILVQIVRGLDKTFIFSSNAILYSMTTILLNILLVIFVKLNIYGLILSNIIGFFVSNVFLMISIKIHNYSIIQGDKDLQKRLILYSIPLIFSSINWWIMNVSDRYIIANYIGMKQLGIYSMANKFSTMLLFVYTIFHMGWQTTSIASYNDKDKEIFFSKIFNYMALAMFSIVVFSLFIIKPFIKFYVSQEYNDIYRYIPALLLSMVFNSFSTFYSVGYLIVKNTKGALYTSLFACLVNVIINMLFIVQFGLKVAVISTFLSFFLMWIIRVITMKEYFKIKISYYNIILFIISLYSLIYLFR